MGHWIMVVHGYYLTQCVKGSRHFPNRLCGGGQMKAKSS